MGVYVDCSFRHGIDLDRQKLPAGADYLYLSDAAASIHRVREQVADRAGVPVIADMLRFLEILDHALDGGQRQLLIRAKDFGKVVPPDVAPARELLAATLPAGGYIKSKAGDASQGPR